MRGAGVSWLVEEAWVLLGPASAGTHRVQRLELCEGTGCGSLGNPGTPWRHRHLHFQMGKPRRRRGRAWSPSDAGEPQPGLKLAACRGAWLCCWAPPLKLVRLSLGLACHLLSFSRGGGGDGGLRLCITVHHLGWCSRARSSGLPGGPLHPGAGAPSLARSS